MREIKIELYAFNELPKNVKANLREEYTNTFEVDFVDYNPLYEGFSERMKEKYGATVSKDDITWSGFWHHGDGLSFTCEFNPETDGKLYKVLLEKATILTVDCFKNNKMYIFSAESVRCSTFHSCEISVEGEVEVSLEVHSGMLSRFDQSFREQTAKHFSEILTEIIRDECRDLYGKLQNHYESHLTDEYINETLEELGEVYTITGQQLNNILGG